MAVSISIRDLTKEFPAIGAARSVTRAVDAVSLEIEPGELFFLLGPSGCGKTTLLRMIAGFTEPTSGRLQFGRRDVTRLPPNRRNTGMVFQSYALWPHMSVEANVGFGLDVRRVGAAEKSARVREALASVRMDAYAARKPNQLSGGQQQRVALARALVIRPDVLLLDEPLSNLDARLRIELRSEIRRICKEAGITSVYVTHDQKEALSMADRVAILDHGRVVQVGTPVDLYRRPRTRFVAEFLGETNFIDGTVVEHAAGPVPPTVVVQTSAGRLVAAAGENGTWAPGAAVTCSIRPESLVIGGRPTAGSAGGNELRGHVVETTYLGEMAQYTVEVAGGTRMRAAELNPRAAGVERQAELSLWCAASDVVVLPR
jgi:iron(III) transport system ATP-binding protein